MLQQVTATTCYLSPVTYRLRRVIAAPPNTLPHHLRELCEHLDPADAEANIQKNPVKNVVKKVEKRYFSGIGATVEKNTKNDAQKLSPLPPYWWSISDPLGKKRQRKINIFWGRLSKQCFLISGAFGGRSGGHFWHFFVKS